MPKTRYHSLDSLRGIASLQVLIAHSLVAVPALAWIADPRNGVIDFSYFLTHSPLSFLWCDSKAVKVFFVLSGFVLSLPFFEVNKQQSYHRFFIKRIVRLYLPCFAIIVISILFIKDLKVNIVVWSLFLEMHFYLFLPFVFLLMYFLKSKKQISLEVIPAFLILISYLYRYFAFVQYQSHAFNIVYESFVANMDAFALGTLGAIYFEKNKEIHFNRKLLSALSITSVIIIFILMYINYNYSSVFYKCVLLFPINNFATIILIVTVLLSKNSFRSYILSSKILAFISLLSYSIYIWHLPIKDYMIIVTSKIYPIYTGKYYILQFFLASVATLIMSYLSYKLIELPFLKQKSENTANLKS